MKFLAMLSVYLALPIVASAQVVVISEPVREKPTLTSWQRCVDGYCFNYSNGTSINETFAAYKKRTGKLPAETRSQCSTGYCGTFSRSPTIATGGCTCGCNAATCNCHHAANAGKPLSQQTYQPGMNQTYNRLRSQIQWR